MAHKRKNCKNLSFCYSIPENLYNEVQNYRFKNEIEYRNEALSELIEKGLKYEALVERHKAKKKRERVLV
ncbi:hypothetical protein [Mesobacillus zeae]|uniref:Uncharacterized protein n=1 Tax=Mesobacillus zeae TaxID=1917180 RepID=A0A398B803_9BACI|nr:hypothetical protein [Mesobacillus zeae]RID85641.1 hypothetical protein D1970_08785 [Mesobacillus zeae]